MYKFNIRNMLHASSKAGIGTKQQVFPKVWWFCRLTVFHCRHFNLCQNATNTINQYVMTDSRDAQYQNSESATLTCLLVKRFIRHRLFELTRTFFSFMSLCKRPWLCRKRIPSTTSRAIWSLSRSDKPAWERESKDGEEGLTVNTESDRRWHLFTCKQSVPLHSTINSPSGPCTGLCAAAP